MNQDAEMLQVESTGVMVSEHDSSTTKCVEDCYRRRLDEVEILEEWNSGTEGGAYCSGDEGKSYIRGYNVPKQNYIWYAIGVEVLAGGGSAGMSYMRDDKKYMEISSHCRSGVLDKQHTKYKIHATIKRLATVDERQAIYARCQKECGKTG